MATAVFSATFDIKDLFNDPQVKKALREREERYKQNMLWLDEDCMRVGEETMAREWNKHSVCDEEWRSRGLRDLTLLDGELWNGSSRSLRAQGRWTSAITAVMEEGVTGKVEEEVVSSVKREKLSSPKMWHCGNGAAWGRKDIDKELEKTAKNHSKCVDSGIFEIGHHERQLDNGGFNTHRQYLKFVKDAHKGDIVFLHCAKKGGLTHWGIYEGIYDDILYDRDPIDGGSWYGSEFRVDEWRPIPDIKKGVGRNCTLYEVTEDSKNYENYMIFT